eukprot:CAMPEP_0119394500 /NCGR_PEP_ID=MMETSP1334-20130426/129586_1 /TAXON_ID=127549 /ORGANISM="Calcidiscus leptoporus, Strain RCC1130" /LENGTH=82 /DNA_ID=CAMNT_0007417775 /DNA_START=300 /DNA_END=545 /DNA_ORIENTATION=+
MRLVDTAEECDDRSPIGHGDEARLRCCSTDLQAGCKGQGSFPTCAATGIACGGHQPAGLTLARLPSSRDQVCDVRPCGGALK